MARWVGATRATGRLPFSPNGNWPQQPHYPQQQQQQDYGAGQFDMGGGHHLQVKINGQTPENYAKNQVSSMVWGWIIGAVILGIVVLTVVGFGIYIYVVAKDDSSPATKAAKQRRRFGELERRHHRRAGQRQVEEEWRREDRRGTLTTGWRSLSSALQR